MQRWSQVTVVIECGVFLNETMREKVADLFDLIESAVIWLDSEKIRDRFLSPQSAQML